MSDIQIAIIIYVYLLEEALGDWVFLFEGNASKHVARGGLQSACVKEFYIYPLQVVAHQLIVTPHILLCDT